MANLRNFVFTSKRDKAFSEELDVGWLCDSDISTLAGNDEVVGRSTNIYLNRFRDSAGVSIANSARLEMGAGNDLLAGESQIQVFLYGIRQAFGIWLKDGALADMGEGNDQVKANAVSATALNISWGAKLLTGAGNDKVFARSEGRAAIYLENGSINTGEGNDSVEGVSFDGGLLLAYSASVFTGSGNDFVTGKSVSNGVFVSGDSVVDTGDGNDQIVGEGGFAGSFGLAVDNSVISSGAGNDRITGINTSGQLFGIAVIGNGLISAGEGNDVVDASIGGFGYGGLIDMGNGNDTVLGFGDILIDGSTGTDKLLLPEGSYSITSNGTFFDIAKDSVTMIAGSVELIGSAFSGNTIDLATGALTVAGDGTLVLV
jgi:hypothetical protein